MIEDRTQCLSCVHWLTPPRGPYDPLRPRTCEAFPEAIPRAIYEGMADHRRPYPGDGGVMWEPLAPGVAFPEDALVETRGTPA